MKLRFLWAAAILFCGSASLLAQDDPSPVVFRASRKTAAAPGASGNWISAEYLGWWITKGPLGIPILTTGDAASPTAGAIGDPSTRVLFGDSSVDFGLFHGGRLSAGHWFGCDSQFGLEGSGYYLAEQTRNFNFASDAAGNPLIAVPFRTSGGVEVRALISSPAPLVVGSVAIALSSQMWGAELNGAYNLRRDCNFSADLLAGVRYDELDETLRIDGRTRFQLPTSVNDTFPVINQTFFDVFNVRNQFYGGQVGARGSYRTGRWSADVLGKAALGVTVHTLTVEGGNTFSIVPNPNLIFPTFGGGFFTKPSNIGTFRTNSFTVIPQLQLNVGYDLTDNIRLTAGYEVLYWSSVNRPGDQIDRIIAPQPGTRPMPLNNHSGLWAHGFKGGVEVRW